MRPVIWWHPEIAVNRIALRCPTDLNRQLGWLHNIERFVCYQATRLQVNKIRCQRNQQGNRDYCRQRELPSQPVRDGPHRLRGH